MRDSESFPAASVGIMLLLPLLIIMISPTRVNPDIGYFMDAGRRIYAGDLPYIDFFSENLLTIKYLYVLPVAIAEHVNFNALSIWLLLNWIGMVASVACAYFLSTKIFARHGMPHLYWLFPLCISLISCLALFTVDFGQREHIFLLASLPWLLYRLCKLEGIAIHRLPAFCIGVAAGLAATIKPHFLIVIVAVESFWLVRGNWYVRGKQIIDPGFIGFLLFPIINVGYFIVFPDALQSLLNWIIPYVFFQRPDLLAGINVLSAIRLFFPLMITSMILVFAITARKRSETRLFEGLAVFSCASGAIVLLQSMRLFYRLMPLYVGFFALCGLIFLLWNETDMQKGRRAFLSGNFLFALVPVVVVFFMVL
ncbi:MAG: hypothetical protein OXE52_12165 [Chloroflexi bacterium]|nr:hypothetical protein [Chloroflexota bacterium]